MAGSATLPRLLLRDRVVVLIAIACVTVLSWLYLLRLDRGMADMPGMTMPIAPPSLPAEVALTVAMWVVMMVGMMLPSAAPIILTFTALHRHKAAAAARWVPTLVFLVGYLLVWSGFALAASLLEIVPARVVMPRPGSSNALIGGALFWLAGLYQLTPLKQVCLRHCRSPFAFLFNRWRDGLAGALRMGLEHGAWCLGCCWLLMALLLVVGAMNLLWVATLALLVLAEKLLRGGPWIARLSGVAAAGYGTWLIVQA
jgi:predicted metal-binding membrane protein